MSEKEMNKRKRYRKNREKWIFVQSVIIVVLTLTVIISAIVSHNLMKTYYIGYNEGGNIDYNVFLKDNEFYEDEYLDSNQSYVASLIDKIIADFSYSIDMDTDDVNYRYSYTIKSHLEIIDDTSNVAIFNPEYELVSVQNKTQSSANRLVINEIVVINYDEYNNLANKFIDTYDLTKVTSNIIITLEVDVISNCTAFVNSSVETYSSELRIPLTTKTVNISMTSKIPDAEAKMIACNRGFGSEVFKTTAIVVGIVDILMILLLIAFVYFTRTEDITYTTKIKKILSQYKSYIQKINNLFETTGYQIILVDTFDEMLEIRDTIQAPILMYENPEKTCTKFIIPTDSKLLYQYSIKIDGYEEPEFPKAPDPAPTTIVKPNITNVVRPVVKVVVTPPPAVKEPVFVTSEPTKEPEPEAIIETIVEEPEIEIEAEVKPVVVAIVEEELEEEVVEEPIEEEPEEEVVEEPIKEELEEEVVEEPVEEVAEEPEEVEETIEEIEDLDVEEILSLIPETEEEIPNAVDAIDVFWKERADKTYRYDPDGNQVEQGDVVLVPTRDVASDKEIVREAEVARGNYKVDSTTLDHPLKKIIGVVKRRATMVFTAMITPNDDEDNQN